MQMGNYMKFIFRGNMSTMSERIWLDNIKVTSEDAPSGVNELVDNQRQVVAVNGGISIDAFEGQTVRVFTIDGRQMDSFVSDGHRTLSMSPGIYIVTVGKQAFKISVR